MIMNEAEFIKLIVDISPAVITVGLTILSVVLGKKYKKFKKDITAFLEVATLIVDAISDDKITLSEVQHLLNHTNELLSDD